MALGTIQLEINNWDKFNPRKDLKATSWLRLQNSIFEDSQFFDFNHIEICFWIYILSQASKKQSNQVTVNLTHALRIGRFTYEDVQSSLKKLNDIDCVTTLHADVTCTSRERHAHDTLRTNALTLHERNETNGDTLHADVTPIIIKPKKPSADSANAELGKQSQLLIAHYCEAWKAKYKTNANVSGMMAGNAKTLIKDHGLNRSLGLVDAFMSMNDTWFIKHRHSFELILTNLAAITHFAGTGVQVTNTQLTQLDKTLSNKNAADGAAAIFRQKENA